jgi:hypothetical protein
MKTVTNAAFIALLEDGGLSWPPFQLGNWVYAQVKGGDISMVGYEIVRTAVPA